MKTKTTLFKPKRSKNYLVQWRDPVTRRKRTRSTGETQRQRAEIVRARIELQLEAGLPRDTLWADAWSAYQAEEWPRLRPTTRSKLATMRRHCETAFNPATIASIGPQHAARLAAHLRAKGNAEHTVAANVGLLRRFLRWCVDRELLPRCPQIRVATHLPSRGKGRAVTGEEFERMMAAVPQVVGEERADGWRHLLHGLWLSGLRLAEALALHWTDSREMVLDTSGKRPMFRLQAARDKSNRFRLFPVAPDFAQWIGQQGRGYVFQPVLQKGGRPTMDQASKTISEIGKAARVVVQEYQRAGEPVAKFASAHDLRRAFGTRWSALVRPALLMELMRHAEISTTLKFYVSVDAARSADEIWQVAKSVAKSEPVSDGNGQEHQSKKPLKQG